MHLEDILTAQRCICGFEGISKKRVITTLSELLANHLPDVDAVSVFDALMAREQLGSTGLGNGIAIPHCRVASCPNIVGALLTLKSPIDFDAIDGKPVDLIFVLIVPEQETDEHLKTLATLAELFNDADFCYTLRHTQDNEDLYNIAISY